MLLELATQPAYLSILGLVVGLAVGSFLNVVIYRLPQMMQRDWVAQCAELSGRTPPPSEPLSLSRPRSRCPKCGHMISAWENIPILSWLLLRGRCRVCAARISIRYPLIEALTAVLSAATIWHFGLSFASASALLLIWVLITLTFIDIDTQLLPDDITLPLLWAGLIVNLRGTFADLESAVIGAIAGYLILWSVYWAFKLVTGKEGMGYGDFKLLAAIGAWFGWQMLPFTLLLSSIVGAIVGITLMVVAKHGRDVPIPFGPYLAAAGVLALFWGQSLTRAYLQLA